MNDPLIGRLIELLLFTPAFVAALTVHEFAHAWAAHRLGDDTAQRQGRLTLDPFVHLDPFGSLMVAFSVLAGFPLLGFAKPVPVNPRQLKNPRRDSMLIALAGPVSNLLQVPIWWGLLWLFNKFAERNGREFLISMLNGLNGHPDLGNPYGVIGMILATGVMANVGIAAFNMIPIPPLDGHYVLEALGPPAVTDFYNAIRPMSMILLYMLLWTGVFGYVLRPVSDFASDLVNIALGQPFDWVRPFISR